VGIDIDSRGLRYVASQVSASANAHFIQADLFKLPLKPKSFDFIFSLGVLHHTPDPRAAFLNLVRLLKPGGQIAIWVYPKSQQTPLSDLLRPITTRLPNRWLYLLGLIVTASYGPLLRIPRLDWRLEALLYRARLPWHKERHWRLHSFMDWYGPKYQFKYSPEDLERWFQEAGLINLVRCTYESSVRGQAAEA
jgi:SAM-dependent methyltransferase